MMEYLKLIYLFFKLSIKQMFCKHEYEFESNEYGDKILEGGFHRSNWYCKKCGRWEGRPYLVGEENHIIEDAVMALEALKTSIKYFD